MWFVLKLFCDLTANMQLLKNNEVCAFLVIFHQCAEHTKENVSKDVLKRFNQNVHGIHKVLVYLEFNIRQELMQCCACS